MNISRSASREAAIRKAINRLNICLQDAGRKPILLMLSGGSALELLAGIEMQYIGRRVTITVLDERFSKDPAVNNFSQIAETEFYKKAERKGIDYIDTRIHRKISLYGLGQRFERGLKNWRKKYPTGKIIITQGIGEDGHTAGIMPYPENLKKFNQLFEKQDRWIVGYNATKERSEYPRRVTVTLPFLRDQVDCSVMYATGSRKKRALKKVFARKGSLERTPARILYEMRNVNLFIDQAL
jgi:6-phosphogluconolactonase/glucosamine-6-phosphate isomerase/deaminase